MVFFLPWVGMLKVEARIQHVAPELQYMFNKLHGLTSQKTDLNIQRREKLKKLNIILLRENNFFILNIWVV